MHNNKNFDYIILKLFLEENINFLTGARLQKIQQPTRKELILNLRNHGMNKKFYVNINPKFFHVCFMGVNEEQKRMLEIPKQPHMFCMLLRKYLESAKIAKVLQPEGERILEFYFETYNELSEKIYLCLAIELMGKHSNIILYNYDTNVIIGCAHNVGSDKSRERELIGGLPYTYPSKRNNNSFTGLSDVLRSETSVNDFIDNYFASLQEEEKIKNLKSKLLTVTKTKLKRIISSLEKIRKQTTTTEKADLYRKKGDLIMANLFHKKDFLSEIEIIDWETNLPLKIKLDETKTLKENANQYYKLYNKAKTAVQKTQEMMEDLQKEKEYFEQVLYSIENSDTMNDLMEINEEFSLILNNHNKRHAELVSGGKCFDPSKPRHPELVSGSYHNTKLDRSRNKFGMTDNLIKKNILNFNVYVGKNNKQNDYIVSKLARDEDLWFHTHNCAGSHVLLRVEAGQEPNDNIIFECAKLAKQYSSAKDSSKVGVIYTKAKNLKKPLGAPLGYVTYKGEKEIIID